MVLLLIFSILLAIVAASFALQNAVPVTVSFFTYRYEASLAVVLLMTLAAGILISLFLLLPVIIRHRITVAKLNRKIKTLTSEGVDGNSQI